MDLLQFVVLTLATWRVTHLIQAEDGPWEVIFRIRKLAGTGFVGSLMDCFYCLSIWVAVPAAIVAGHNWTEYIYYTLAISGSAILIQKFSMACCNEKRAAWQEATATATATAAPQPGASRPIKPLQSRSGSHTVPVPRATRRAASGTIRPGTRPPSVR